MSINENRKLRAIIVDDSAFYRRLLSEVVRGIPDVEVVATAFDGEDCLAMIEKHRPDFVTMDLQMPRRDGLSTLAEIQRRGLQTEVIMVCAENRESADQTMQALKHGALDMILKPSSSEMAENQRSLHDQIVGHLDTIRTRMSLVRRSAPQTAPAPASPRSFSAPVPTLGPTTHRPSQRFAPACVCIGVSTGGPQSLGTVLGQLPNNLPVPIFIVQHMPPMFTRSLADHLNRSAAIAVSEAVNGEMAQDGHVYIAQGGKQMKIEKLPAGIKIHVTDDPPLSSCKPSVDYLFQSVASSVGGNALAIILTGMGNDGLAGCRTLRKLGAHVIAQNAETCVVYGMPRQIVEANLANEILPLNEVGSRIVQLLPMPSRL